MGFVIERSRVVSALVVREMSTRFGTKVGGYLWAIVDPIAHVALLTLIFGAIARIPPLGSEFVIFFASGYLALLFYTSTVGQINGAVSANRTLLQYPIVLPIDTVLARYILQFMTNLLVTLIVLGGSIALTDPDSKIDYLPIIEACFVASVLALGIGMFNIVMFRRSSLYEKAFGIVSRPLLLISGVFFLVEDVPQPYRDWLLWNPVAHVVMWLRTGVYPYYEPTYLDESYLLVCTGCAVLIGGSVFTASKRTLRAA